MPAPPTNLTAVGICVYNGYTFSAYSETLGFRSRPQYDQSGRTVVYTEYTITMRERIFGTESEVATQLNDMRNRLTANGGAFSYSFKGVGTFEAALSTCIFRLAEQAGR